MQRHSVLRLAILAALGLSSLAQAQTQSANEQSVEELRSTLVSVMEALVQKGVLTREQAQQIVANAQDKAAAASKAQAAQAESEKDAVRVTYVPEIVRDEISKQVSEQLKPQVAQQVVAQAKAEKWGVPGALPDWLSRITWSGDIRLRFQGDNYADDNIAGSYKNYTAINSAGGETKAGTAALLNVTEDRLRERLRVRLGLDAQITSGISAGVRLATGSLTDPISTNQTLGNSSNRYQIAVDQAYLRYELKTDKQLPWMTVWGGRLPNPWVSTDLVWDPDLQFEGVASKWRYNFGSSAAARNVFFTAGAFPLQEIELSAKDKWLYGGQLGLEWPWAGGGRAVLAGAYYYYDRISGQLNEPGSTLLNFTAPQSLQKGNTLFDILNDSDTTSNLYALAGDYHLLNGTAILELPVANHLVTLTADYVSNIGYDKQRVLQRRGFSSLDAVAPDERFLFDEQTTGLQFLVSFGTQKTGRRGDWRAEVGYKYLERDAVVDAFTDSDFHLGGTAAKGYSVKTDWWFRDRNWVTVRYLSSNEISSTVPSIEEPGKVVTDTAPFGVDTWMFDLNAQF
ncbi:MAG: putative porin [Steroidobacteraceae bacterium]